MEEGERKAALRSSMMMQGCRRRKCVVQSNKEQKQSKKQKAESLWSGHINCAVIVSHVKTGDEEVLQ